VPSFDSGDNFVGIGCPGEGLWLFIMLGDEAVDGGLKIDDRVEHPPFQAALGELGKEALDGVEPRTGRWREVKYEARVPVEPCADLGVFVGGVIVEDHVHRLVGWHACINGVQEADELLMPVLLHIPSDHGAIEDVERGEQRGRAVPLVIMSHRAEPPLLERQPWLRAVERLNLALLIKRQHDRMRGRIDIKPNNIVEFICELGIVRQLELPEAMRLQTMRLPDAAHRAGADTAGSRHHIRCPVCRLARGIGQGQRNHAFGHLGRKRGNARRPGLVTQQTVHACGHESLLPAPHAGLRLARLPHDRSRADPIGGQQNDRSAPDMLLRRIAISGHALKAETVRWRNFKEDTSAHKSESHGPTRKGIPKRTLVSGVIH
jgi:hypothetical protein